MENSKITLPLEVAEALDKALKWARGDREIVAWVIPQRGESEGYWSVLYKYADEQHQFFRIIDALRYGYEVDDPQEKKRAELLENLKKIGYEGESANIIVDTIAPIIFEGEK